MNRILFITDSVGLPRLWPEKIGQDIIWTYKVAEKISKVLNGFCFYYYCHNGLTSTKVEKALSNVLGAYSPDIVILQIGIVDCAPRALKFNELAILSRIPILKTISHIIVKRFYKRIIKLRNTTYVTIQDFEKSLRLLKKYFNNAEFIVIPIAPACDNYKLRNPLIDRNINRYNKIMKDIFLEQFMENAYKNLPLDRIFISDNHHLNKFGNEIISEMVFNKIMQIYAH